jgi:hypothetical protein
MPYPIPTLDPRSLMQQNRSGMKCYWLASRKSPIWEEAIPWPDSTSPRAWCILSCEEGALPVVEGRSSTHFSPAHCMLEAYISGRLQTCNPTSFLHHTHSLLHDILFSWTLTLLWYIVGLFLFAWLFLLLHVFGHPFELPKRARSITLPSS